MATPDKKSNDIPLARSDAIGDRMLKSIRDVAYNAQRGDLTMAEAELMLSTMGPLLDELIERRNVQAMIAQHLEDNVVYLEDIQGKHPHGAS